MGGEVSLFPVGEITQEHIVNLQIALSQFEQLDPPVKHYFSPGLYCREIFMPKGSFVVGKLHATEHPNIMSVGDCSVWTAHEGLTRIRGPHTWISKAGVKKALYVHEDTVWTTCHVTKTTDLIELERELIIDQPIDHSEAMALALELQNELRSLKALEYSA